jgi:hypothetical protein
VEVETQAISAGEAVESSLLDLVDELRHAGFEIGVNEILRGQELLVALAAEGLLPCELETLRNYLAALFCSTPVEQQTFHAHFTGWLSRHAAVGALLVKDWGQEEGTEQPANLGGVLNKLDNRISPLCLLAATGVSLLIVIVGVTAGALFFTTPVQKVIAGHVVDEDGAPVSGAVVKFAGGTARTDAAGDFNLAYGTRPGTDDLVISHDDFEAWHKDFPTHDRAPANAGSAIVLTRRASPADAVDGGVYSSPTFKDEDRANFEKAVSKVNAFSRTSQIVEPLTGWRRLYYHYYDWARALVTALPLLFSGLWCAWVWYRRRLILKQREAGGHHDIDNIIVRGVREEVFPSECLARISHKYRAHASVPARELESTATVHRTARSAGLFTPVYGLRQVRPEYLVLIDRADFKDHQAAYFDAMLTRLAAEGVYVNRYFFDGDPRLCFGPQADAPPLSLAELASKHAEDRVLVFSDGGGFMSDLSGRPKVMVEMFESWAQKALLTPQTPPHWGYRERSLAERGFTVLHAGEDGLGTFIEAIQTGEKEANSPRTTWEPPYPPVLVGRPARWLERRAPDKVEEDVLIAQLRYFLGEAGFYWLAACAVYPAPRWDVTLFLGYHLRRQGERLLRQRATLLKLARLPWFRHGHMPAWLRARLLDELAVEQQHTVRDILQELLLSHLEHPKDGVPLEFALDAKKLSPRRRQRLLRALYGSLDEQSPLYDYIFLTFMSGRKPNRMEMELPDAVSRSIARNRMRPLRAFTIGAVFALFGWLQMSVLRPQVNYISLVPTFTLSRQASDKNALPPSARSELPLSTYYDNLRRYRAQTLETLLKGASLGDSRISLDALDAETVDAYALRPVVYSLWLEDMLRREAPEVDLAAVRINSLPIADGEDWRGELLYLEPVPTGPVEISVIAPVVRSGTGAGTGYGPGRGYNIGGGGPGGGGGIGYATPTPTPTSVEFDTYSTEGRVVMSLAATTQAVKGSTSDNSFIVEPYNVQDLSLSQLGVSDASTISAFKFALVRHEPQLRDSINSLDITPTDTVKGVVLKVNTALRTDEPYDEARAALPLVYILYDEVNKSVAQAAERDLRAAGYTVQSYVAYKLDRPQGIITFRPKDTPARSITYFDDSASGAARNIQSLVSKVSPGIELLSRPLDKTDTSYFAAFIRAADIKVQISLLDPNAWRGALGDVSTRTAAGQRPSATN